MGQRMISFCDVTGEEGDDVEFHTIVIDGKAKGLDMSQESYRAMLMAMEPYLKCARPVRAEPASVSTVPEVNGRKIAVPGQTHPTEERLALKLWADEHGVYVRSGQTPVPIWQAFYDDDLSKVPADRFIKNRAVA